MTLPNAARIAFVGFGEAARAFLGGWAPADPTRISAFDVKSDHADTAEAMLSLYRAHGISGAPAIAAALNGADMIFSVVTADQAEAAALAAAQSGALAKGALWFDCNSCAPETKRRAALAIEAAGGRYVDVAVMAPVYPKRHLVPLRIAGPHARAASEALKALEMCPVIAGDQVGQASSIKMIRSVMIKGFEALTTECFLAARAAGVEEAVLASLELSDPDIPWRRRGAYNLERMMVHGSRRAAEMREVAVTLADLGLPAGMTTAAAQWQDRVADSGARPDQSGHDSGGRDKDAELLELLDQLRRALIEKGNAG